MSFSHKPLVSVIIPLHNKGQYLTECLDSVLNQTYDNIEIIVVENCSTDNSMEIATGYLNQGIQLLTSNIPSASKARNVGINAAKGYYLQFLDADDTLPLDKIEKQVKLLYEYRYAPDVIAICEWRHRVDTRTTLNMDLIMCHDYEKPTDMLYDMAINDGSTLLHSYLVSKQLVEYSGLWDESLTKNDDGEFMARLLSNAQKIVFSRDVIVEYRNTPNSLSKGNSKKDIISEIRSLISIIRIMDQHYNPSFGDRVSKICSRHIRHYYPYFPSLRNEISIILKNRGFSNDCLKRKPGIVGWVKYFLVKCHIAPFPWD